ncbi:MAG: sulfur transferase domain-containing protein [Planctomycetota bacterium]
MRPPSIAPFPLAVALLAAACSAEPTDAPKTVTQPDVDLTALSIPNASTPLEGVLAAGQISPEQMDALHAAGYRSFISLRVAEERGAGWEEAHAAEKDIRFVRLPVAGAAGVDEAHARQLGELMGAEERPMVVYCGSSNRVGALFGLKAFHVDGMGAEEALALGKAAGVTGLEPHFKEQLGL